MRWTATVGLLLISWSGVAAAQQSGSGQRPHAVADTQPAPESTRGVFYTPPKGVKRTGFKKTTKIYDRSYAVVIGVNQYQNDNLPDLQGAVRDARRVAEVFAAHGMEVKLFLDGAATRKAIVQHIGDELPNNLGPDDRVLIYFAGHGRTWEGGDAAEMGYLMPVDSDRDNPRSTGISMLELQAWFAKYPAKHVMFVADACYSGLAFSTRATGLSLNAKKYLKRVSERKVRIALIAGGAGQEAHELENEGVFTHYFLEAIGGSGDDNGDGIVTSDEISHYVRPRVSDLVARNFNTQQEPTLGRQGDGEFFFLNPALVQVPKPGFIEMVQAPSSPGVANMPSSVAVQDDEQRVWTWVALGVGGAAAVGAGVTGGMVLSNSSSLKDSCDGDVCPESEENKLGKTKNLATAATVLTGVAAAGVATAVVLYFVEPGLSDSSVTVGLAPVEDGVALSVGGRF